VKHAWVLLLVAASGCVDLKQPYPDRKFYTVEARRGGAERPPAAGSVLRVRTFGASKMCDGAEIVTRTEDAVYETDFYNVFFMPPAQQVREQTLRWIAGSKLFAHIVGNGSSVAETHVLEGSLVSMVGDYRKNDSPVAVLEIQFMLVRVSTEPVAILHQKIYRQEIPIPTATPEFLIKGWADGLTKILAALEDDLAKGERSEKK